jgi:Putative bacterial sensory transduction regulator
MKKDKFILLARKAGFAVERVEGQSFRFEAAGLACAAFLSFDRQGDQVISVQLYCGFSNQVDPRAVDAWNRELRFVRAYTGPNGQLSLDMDLIVPSEMTAEHLRDAWRIWSHLLARVPSMFRYREPEPPSSEI